MSLTYDKHITKAMFQMIEIKNKSQEKYLTNEPISWSIDHDNPLAILNPNPNLFKVKGSHK